MYMYSILLFIIILFILFLNQNDLDNGQLGGKKKKQAPPDDRPNFDPEYHSVELTTLDYNNVIFGEIHNFILYDDELFNLNITIDSNKQLTPFYIDLLNEKNDTDYILRINSAALGNNNTIKLVNIGTNTPSSNIITNNLNNKTSQTNYLKITPVKNISILDELYSPLLIDSIDIKIIKNTNVDIKTTPLKPKLVLKNEKKEEIRKVEPKEPNILQSITTKLINKATDKLPTCDYKSQPAPVPHKPKEYKIGNIGFTFGIFIISIASYIFGFLI